MSDVTTPKKRPQRPAAPSWAARKKTRPDAADGRETGELAAARETGEIDTRAGAGETGEIDTRAAAQAEQEAATAEATPAPPSQPVVIPRPAAIPRPIAGAPRLTPTPPAPSAVVPEPPAKAGTRRISIPPAPRLAPATIPPGMAPIVDAQKDEPEAVSLQEIETLLSPGKAPGRTGPGARISVTTKIGARAAAATAAAEPPGPTRPDKSGSAPIPPSAPRTPLESLDEPQPVPMSSRWNDANGADIATMANLVPAPRQAPARGQRVTPLPASTGPTSAGPTVDRSLPKDASRSDIELMAALGAVPAKKDVAPASFVPPAPGLQAKAKAVAVLSPEAAAALKGTRPAPAASGGAARATAPVAEKAAPLTSPLERDAPPNRSAVADAAEVEETGWVEEDEPEPPRPAPRRITVPPPPGMVVDPSGAPAPRAMDAAARANPRGSAPDVTGTLRDAPNPDNEKTTRGSVVDPMELYGATPAGAQPKAKPKLEPMTSARAALAEAELKAVAASAELGGAKPKVDLPARAEPRPFPKPPQRRPGSGTNEAEAAAGGPAKAPGKPPGKPPPPHPMPVRVGPPARIKVIDPEPVSMDGVELEDDIPIDFTPESEEPVELSPSSMPNSDSGRFNLQQLMSGPGPRSSNKGRSDAELLGLAGDLFTDGASAKLTAPDLGAKGAQPAPSSRLLAPVALGTAQEAGAPRSVPSAAKPVLLPLGDVEAPAKPRRRFNPWLLLPLLALGVAAFLVYRGQSTDATPDTPPLRTATQATQDTAPTATTPPVPATATSAPTAEPTATATPPIASSAATPPPAGTDTAAGADPGPRPPVTASVSGTSPPASTVTSPGTAATTTKTAPTATATVTAAPQAAAGAFDAAAAKSAAKSAAAGASGCPSDTPGVAVVSVTWAPSGRVTQSQVSGAFAGTTTGGCIASLFRKATIPPFEGSPQSLSFKVTLR